MKALKANKINFIESNKEQDEKKREKKGQRQRRFLWPLIGLALVIGGISGYYAFQVFFVLEPQMEASIAYIEDPSVMTAYDDMLLVMDERDMLKAEEENLNTVMAALATYPKMTADIYSAIRNPAGAGIQILSLEYASAQGSLNISAVAPSALSSADYAGALRRSEVFSYTSYHGYQSANQGSFSFSIPAILIVGGENNE